MTLTTGTDAASRLLALALKEQQNGNSSITDEKIARLKECLSRQSAPPRTDIHQGLSPIYYRYKLPLQKTRAVLRKRTFENQLPPSHLLAQVEAIAVKILETLALLLDNLHLILKLPVFPKFMHRLVKHTNSVWAVVLVFLIKRATTLLLRLNRQEQRVQRELDIVQTSYSEINRDIASQHSQTLKSIAMERIVLYGEIAGNGLDLLVNIIEMKKWKLPWGIMGLLNVSSTVMSIYRVNK